MHKDFKYILMILINGLLSSPFGFDSSKITENSMKNYNFYLKQKLKCAKTISFFHFIYKFINFLFEIELQLDFHVIITKFVVL